MLFKVNKYNFSQDVFDFGEGSTTQFSKEGFLNITRLVSFKLLYQYKFHYLCLFCLSAKTNIYISASLFKAGKVSLIYNP